MAYKIAFISKNDRHKIADDFMSFAREHGVDFEVAKFCLNDLSDASRFAPFDAVILSSSQGTDERVADTLSKELSLYAKCVFKCADLGNLTQPNIVLVTDISGESNGGFATGNEFGRYAHASKKVSELEIERTARIAYELAEMREQKLTLSDVPIESHIVALWRKIVSDINEDYPSVRLNFESTFDTALKLATNEEHGVVLTENGNFHALSGAADAHSALGVGTSTVAYLGETTVGVYGTERATVGADVFDALALSKMLELSFDLPKLSDEWKRKIPTLLLQK